MKKITSLMLSFVMLVSLTLCMGSSVFAAVSETDNGIRYVENGENAVKIVDYAGTDVNVTIPDTISGKKVTRITNNAFFNNTTIKSLSIPASVTEIDDMVICYCPNLAAIKVAADNKYYDSRNNCNAIIETATNTLIAGCKNTKVPNGVTKISGHAFDGCSGLAEITLPESVKAIQHKTFGDCSNLKDITFLNKNCKICDTCKAGDKTCDFTISKSATIHGYKGSTAEKYAKEYGRKFAAVSEAKLSAPTLKVAVNANGSFTLSWNKIAGAEKYGIYTKQSNGTYKWVKTVTGTSFTTAVAPYGQQYSYSVLAVTGNVSSKYSNVVTVKNTKKLQTPTLKGTVNANGSFTLSWNKIAGATKYGIYYKNANGTYTWVTTVTGTSWSTATAQYGKTFTYKILAVGSTSSIVSEYSKTVSVTNNKKLQTPTLKATVNKNGSFKLSWGKVTGAEKYGIYVKQLNGTYKWIKTVTGTSYTIGVAKKGTTYTYKVVAVTSKNKNATSNYSSAVSVKR